MHAPLLLPPTAVDDGRVVPVQVDQSLQDLPGIALDHMIAQRALPVAADVAAVRMDRPEEVGVGGRHKQRAGGRGELGGRRR